MAITHDAATGNSQVADDPSFSHTVGTVSPNRVLLLFVAIWVVDGQTIDAASYGGQSMALIASRSQQDSGLPGDFARTAIFGLKNPPTGANTVQITTSASCHCNSLAMSKYGVDQTTPWDGATGSDADDSSSYSFAVTSRVDDLVLDGCSLGNANDDDVTPGGGQTQRADDSGNAAHLFVSEEAGAASVTMSA